MTLKMTWKHALQWGEGVLSLFSKPRVTALMINPSELITLHLLAIFLLENGYPSVLRLRVKYSHTITCMTGTHISWLYKLIFALQFPFTWFNEICKDRTSLRVIDSWNEKQGKILQTNCSPRLFLHRQKLHGKSCLAKVAWQKSPSRSC